MPLFKSKIFMLASITLLWSQANSIQATPLFGNTFSGIQGAVLYDVNPETGLATNPRLTDIDHIVGISFSPNGLLYGLSNSAAPENPNSLFNIDPITGESQFIGSTNLEQVIEGDLAFDPTTGTLYGIYNLLGTGERQLFTLDTASGAASVIPGSLSGDPSAMAFDAAGNLYVIDTSLQKLLTMDKATGATLNVTSLSISLGSVAGMDVDPATGVFYVADGGSGGTDMLYTLDPSTGVLTEVGPTGAAEGLAGLAFIPEPATVLFLAIGGIAIMRRQLHCRRT